MIKIFFATFFIAELIIALAIILKIHTFNKCVNNWNNAVLANQDKIRVGLCDFRQLMEDFSGGILWIKGLIRRKREEYIIRVLKNTLIYGGFFLLKGKYKKRILAYQLIKEIYEGLQEA